MLVMFGVFFLALTNYEIFNSIVVFYSVDVVYNLIVVQIATKFFLHHKSMLKHISTYMSIRVIFGKNKHISDMGSSTVNKPWVFIWMISDSNPSTIKASSVVVITRQFFSAIKTKFMHTIKVYHVTLNSVSGVING
jgi:hypothetical protein